MRSEVLSKYYEAFHRERGKEGTVTLPERLDFIRREVGTGKDVVELGCRYGDLLSLFVAENRVVGCDIDREAVERCRARFGIEAEVVNLNESLPYPSSAFDVVVISEVLEHLPYPEITLLEVKRVLRPGGKLVGSVPNGTRIPNRFRFLFTGVVEPDRTHLWHFSPASLQSTLSGHFGDVEVKSVGGRYCRFAPKYFGHYLLFTARA